MPYKINRIVDNCVSQIFKQICGFSVSSSVKAFERAFKWAPCQDWLNCTLKFPECQGSEQACYFFMSLSVKRLLIPLNTFNPINPKKSNLELRNTFEIVLWPWPYHSLFFNESPLCDLRAVNSLEYNKLKKRLWTLS